MIAIKSLFEDASAVSVVAVNLPEDTTFLISSGNPSSLIGDLPALMAFTMDEFWSAPMTRAPASAKRHAKGKPIQPSPTISTVKSPAFSFDGISSGVVAISSEGAIQKHRSVPSNGTRIWLKSSVSIRKYRGFVFCQESSNTETKDMQYKSRG